MTISHIEIRNIKGIEHKSFQLQLKPHKPNLLVAPNGFGKSSVATAFSSMNTKRIDLAEKDHHKEDVNLSPTLTIRVDNQEFTADTTKNEIRKKFDVLVINSGLISEAKRHFRGAVSSSLGILPITICKIPTKATFAYKYTQAKDSFGQNGKILPNISELLKNPKFFEAIQGVDLSKVTQVRIQTAIKSIVDKVNFQNGTIDTITKWISDNYLDELRAVSVLNSITERLIQSGAVGSEIEGYFAAYQVVEIYAADPKSFVAAMYWLRYVIIKAHYESLLANFKSSNWQWAKIEEIKNKKELIVSFPRAHQLSNGQRDIITLVVQLHKTLYEGSKKPLILVIDEVFDYLDDANLVAFQYYVTSIIEAYKERDQTIYPIILTHLDPGVFFDFCFNKHKLQINYLQAKSIGKSQHTLRIIEARDNSALIKDRLEMYWFHFHTDECVISEDEWPTNLPQDWQSSELFRSYTHNELNRYLNLKNYDPIAVCFAVRISVEKLCYELLSNDNLKTDFLETKKTKNKMDFAARNCVDIPESYFLLGLIYNTNLHWSQGRDYVSPLSSKLSHPTIRKLIKDVAERIT